MQRFEAQLAGGAKNGIADFADATAWAIEAKLDGIRALIEFDGERVSILNRRGENKGRGAKNAWLIQPLQDLATLVPELTIGTVLDGELVADTWNQTMEELARNGDHLRYVVFDLPVLMGRDLRHESWQTRRQLLEKLAELFPERIVLSPLLPYSADLAEQMWAAGGEGLVIKKRTSPYECGGRKFWFKIKEVHTAEAWICGFEPGKGKYANTVGAVKLCQMRDGKPTEITQISGMDDATRYALSPADIGRVVEFKYHQRTADNYRHPRWLRWRDDKQQSECTWEATE